MVLFYAIESLRDDLVTTTLRTTDHYSKLEENLFLIILGETGIEGGIIASEKLLPKLRCKPGQLIYSAVAECSKEKEGVSLVLQLFNILEFAVEHQHTDEVVDSSYLDGIY